MMYLWLFCLAILVPNQIVEPDSIQVSAYPYNLNDSTIVDSANLNMDYLIEPSLVEMCTEIRSIHDTIQEYFTIFLSVGFSVIAILMILLGIGWFKEKNLIEMEKKAKQIHIEIKNDQASIADKIQALTSWQQNTEEQIYARITDKIEDSVIEYIDDKAIIKEPNDTENKVNALEKLINDEIDIRKRLGLKQDPKIYYRKGRKAELDAKYTEAKEFFTKAIEISDDNSIYYLWIGLTETQLKQYEEAVINLSKSIDLYADEQWAYALLGISYIELENFKKALTYLDIGIEKFPENATLYSLRASVYLGLHRDPNIKIEILDEYSQKALIDAKIGYKISDGEYVYNLACAYAVNKKIDEAFAYLEEAIKVKMKKGDISKEWIQNLECDDLDWEYFRNTDDPEIRSKFNSLVNSAKE